MSLILNNDTTTSWNMAESPDNDDRSAELLDHYLALMEINRKSARFVPDDALLALDMAGFVRDRISGHGVNPKVSVARMALALVQPMQASPIQ